MHPGSLLDRIPISGKANGLSRISSVNDDKSAISHPSQVIIQVPSNVVVRIEK